MMLVNLNRTGIGCAYLYRSKPAALLEPLVGVVAFSESLANRSTVPAVRLRFAGDTAAASVPSEHGMTPGGEQRGHV